MSNGFFCDGELELEIIIRELRLIAPYYYKGTIETAKDLYFKINDTTYSSGLNLYLMHRKILREALGILISENYSYVPSDYNKRILLNYAVGFLKTEKIKEENKLKQNTVR